ncbi:hypothetical protein [Pseudonocardia hydrocarbonoxydans]|uniref:hypothetical protein n=1 Tax=Pseudonocardia hydrocarbonoxydans TaxID=76726 RepID=UPI0011439C12|nr:hypothetical protein [Pseudonocardia hydrocarbonoxydans]
MTCGAGLHLIASVRDMAWQSGLTDGDGYSVPVCQEGFCGNLYTEMERAIVAFRFPRGIDARLELEKFEARAKFGPEDQWMTITAVTMLRVFEYHSVVKERLRRERLAALLAEEEAARAAARAAAPSPEEQKAARRAAFAEQERMFREMLPDLFSVEGVDPELAAAFARDLE